MTKKEMLWKKKHSENTLSFNESRLMRVIFTELGLKLFRQKVLKLEGVKITIPYYAVLKCSCCPNVVGSLAIFVERPENTKDLYSQSFLERREILKRSKCVVVRISQSLICAESILDVIQESYAKLRALKEVKQQKRPSSVSTVFSLIQRTVFSGIEK